MTGPDTGDPEMDRFLNDLMKLLHRYGLAEPDYGEPDPSVPEERAATVLLTEVNDWFRAGRIDPSLYGEDFMPDDPTWAEFCRAFAQANIEADKVERGEREP